MSITDAAPLPHISVVMPVHNVQEYLAWSVRSVLDQSYPHFQLICVDDGSTDASGQLLDALAQTDERIHALHQANCGVSAARNAGIRSAQGDVIVFLDPDDALRPDALETVAAAYEATAFDVLVYGAHPYPAFEASVWLDANLSPRSARYETFEPRVLFNESSHPFVWRTACRREFLERHHIRFDDEVAFGEDQLFHFSLFPHSENTVFIADKLVDYRVKREGSLMATRFGDLAQRAHEHIATLERILNVWEAHGWLQRWPDELFEWSIDFMLPSLILTRNDQEHRALVEELRTVWVRSFSEDFLVAQTSSSCFGPVINMVLEGKPAAISTLLITRFVLRARAFGISYAIREAVEQPWALLTRADQRRKRLRAEWRMIDAENLRAAQESFGISEIPLC